MLRQVSIILGRLFAKIKDTRRLCLSGKMILRAPNLKGKGWDTEKYSFHVRSWQGKNNLHAPIWHSESESAFLHKVT